MKAMDHIGSFLNFLFFNLVPCILMAENFLFHTEQGRKDYLDKLRASARSRGENPRQITSRFPLWVHLVVIAAAILFANFCYWLTDLKLGAISVVIGIAILVGAIFCIVVMSRTPYQARAWSHAGVMGAFILTYALQGVAGKGGYLILGVILILAPWILGKIIGHMLEDGTIIRGASFSDNFVSSGESNTPQIILTIGIILVAIVVLILIF